MLRLRPYKPCDGFVDNPKMENTVKIINGEEWIVKELIVTRDAEKESLR